jgi:hypothetical protein
MANPPMSHFPVKSGNTAAFARQERLTDGLPDVGTGWVLQSSPDSLPCEIGVCGAWVFGGCVHGFGHYNIAVNSDRH